jgi:hypothetical protein
MSCTIFKILDFCFEDMQLLAQILLFICFRFNLRMKILNLLVKFFQFTV